MAAPDDRRNARTPITLKIKFKSSSLDQFIERYSVDVSRGGIFIRTKEPLPVGTTLRFEFQLQDGSSLIGGEGTVVWNRAYDPNRGGVAPGMGVRFDKLTQDSQRVLDRILGEKHRRGEAQLESRFDAGVRASREARSHEFLESGTPLPAPAPGLSPSSQSGGSTFGDEPTRMMAADQVDRLAAAMKKPDDFANDQPTRRATLEEVSRAMRGEGGPGRTGRTSEQVRLGSGVASPALTRGAPASTPLGVGSPARSNPTLTVRPPGSVATPQQPEPAPSLSTRQVNPGEVDELIAATASMGTPQGGQADAAAAKPAPGPRLSGTSAQSLPAQTPASSAHTPTHASTPTSTPATTSAPAPAQDAPVTAEQPAAAEQPTSVATPARSPATPARSPATPVKSPATPAPIPASATSTPAAPADAPPAAAPSRHSSGAGPSLQALAASAASASRRSTPPEPAPTPAAVEPALPAEVDVPLDMPDFVTKTLIDDGSSAPTAPANGLESQPTLLSPPPAESALFTEALAQVKEAQAAQAASRTSQPAPEGRPASISISLPAVDEDLPGSAEASPATPLKPEDFAPPPTDRPRSVETPPPPLDSPSRPSVSGAPPPEGEGRTPWLIILLVLALIAAAAGVYTLLIYRKTDDGAGKRPETPPVVAPTPVTPPPVAPTPPTPTPKPDEPAAAADGGSAAGAAVTPTPADAGKDPSKDPGKEPADTKKPEGADKDPAGGKDSAEAPKGLTVPITSDPPGAQVELGDTALGTTPTQATGLSAGKSYELKFTLRGYQDQKHKFKLVDGDNKPVQVKLLAYERVIEVTSTPKGAEIFIDGKRQGKTPTVLKKFDTSKVRQIEVRKAGYATQQRNISDTESFALKNGKEVLTINLTLEQTAGGKKDKEPKHKAEPAKDEGGKGTEAPKADAPKADPPKAEAPKADPPKADKAPEADKAEPKAKEPAAAGESAK